MLVDLKARQNATDPSRSFIVQAPAGSGKTELLTQRYLRLLSVVSAPEQIIALTFTRKAASEMRERIIKALQNAQQNIAPTSEHQQQTLEYARTALNSDKVHQWNLLQHPNRFRIITIDSLCQNINQAIPLLEKNIIYSGISEKSESLYRLASKRCIQFALNQKEYQEDIKNILLHVDNRQDRLLQLFCSMLASRDHWLKPLFQAKSQYKSDFEHALQEIEEHELKRLRESLPPQLALELCAAAAEVSYIENNTDSPRYLLQSLKDFASLDRELSKALASLLLTSTNQFRKSFDHHVGISSKSCPGAEYKSIKERSKILLTQLLDYPEFLNSLIQVCNLPAPKYEFEQWQVLESLFQLLPLLVGHLNLVFIEKNVVDFTAVSQYALEALGESDNPTELALYLDNSIQHLLIDEFQDTSINQFELIQKLITGWQRDEGRTLFLVGDPMQSIYRFRQAEVGLFLRAKNQGIGDIKLKSLELRCNFRSTATIVEWINRQFSQIFPQSEDIQSGAIPFYSSVHIKEKSNGDVVQAIQCSDKNHQAETLIKLLKQEMNQNPGNSLAILVRSRTQLTEVLSLLRKEKIPYQGNDIALLSNLFHVRDVFSLTQALLFPGNRLAWLALLRSPYCGIDLKDLLLIAEYNPQKSLYYALSRINHIQNLSEDAKTRASYFFQVMHDALTNRYQHKLSTWILETLKKLHHEFILDSQQQQDLEQYWSLIDRHDQSGRIEIMSDFLKEFNSLYSKRVVPAQLQVMTIHKSKGLEFDTVFLPSLGSKTYKGEQPLIRWLHLPTEARENCLLMSPIKAADKNFCAVYDYLAKIDALKDHYESQRLFYVAATRTKQRLYMLDYNSNAATNSFKSYLVKEDFSFEPEVEVKNSEITIPSLQKLPLEFYSLDNRTPTLTTPHNISSHLNQNISRIKGIVAHRLLQWVCQNHVYSIENLPWKFTEQNLKAYGFTSLERQSIMDDIKKQIVRFLDDPIGQWISSSQQNEANELEFLTLNNGKTELRIVDRLFIADNKLWIIDYKTGYEDKKNLQQHQAQLISYSALLSQTTELEIQCGIYYLQSNHWINWKYENLIEALT